MQRHSGAKKKIFFYHFILFRMEWVPRAYLLSNLYESRAEIGGRGIRQHWLKSFKSPGNSGKTNTRGRSAKDENMPVVLPRNPRHPGFVLSYDETSAQLRFDWPRWSRCWSWVHEGKMQYLGPVIRKRGSARNRKLVVCCYKLTVILVLNS